MPEINSPMRKQSVYAEGKIAFLYGKRRSNNPYRWHNKELASIWVNGWDQAKKDNQVKDRRLT